jgi:hypothetical protein
MGELRLRPLRIWGKVMPGKTLNLPDELLSAGPVLWKNK